MQAFEITRANLIAASRRADVSRLKQLRDEIRSALGGLRNVRKFPDHYNSKYLGGAAGAERRAVRYLQELWEQYRAFYPSMRARRA